MSDDPFSDPTETQAPPIRGRQTTKATNQQKMEPDVQEIRVVESRTKPSRTVTTTGSTAPPVPPKRRSNSQDGVLQAAAAIEKARATKGSSKASKKGGLHVDVIDRLDYSGVGPATFHHDGPFDACAPSRNRHRTKAPMLAWTPGQDPSAGAGGIVDVPDTDMTQSTINALSNNDSPYANIPSPTTTKKSKHASKETPKYEYPRRPASPKRRDTLADAWGKGEPEPFEEFFAESVVPAVIGQGESGFASAASSLYAGKEGHNINGTKDGKKRDRTTGGVRKATNRPPLPPPQPIFPASENDASTEDDPQSVELGAALSSSSGGGPRRSKSLMQRIKKMRDAPNVPVDYDDANEKDPSGRFGNKSPTSPGVEAGDNAGDKVLPGLPPPTTLSPRDRDESGGYFDRGVGRKTSIMQKVRGVVVGKNK